MNIATCNLFLVSLFKIMPFHLPLSLHPKCVPLYLNVTRFARTFRQRINKNILVHIRKIQLLLLWLASDMLVNTKSDRKFDIGIRNL